MLNLQKHIFQEKAPSRWKTLSTKQLKDATVQWIGLMRVIRLLYAVLELRLAFLRVQPCNLGEVQLNNPPESSKARHGLFVRLTA